MRGSPVVVPVLLISIPVLVASDDSISRSLLGLVVPMPEPAVAIVGSAAISRQVSE